MGNSYTSEMNSTFHSITTDDEDQRRWASFEYYPLANGKNRLVYKGISFASKNIEDPESMGYQQDQSENTGKSKKRNTKNKNIKCRDKTVNSYWSKRKCVVKSATDGDFVEKDPHNTESQWFRQKIFKSSEYAEIFSNEIGTETVPQMRFAKSYLAKVDSMTSIWNPICNCLCGFRKRFWKNDFVILEERIEGIFQHYVFIDGSVDENCPDVLQAFVHFSYHYSSGKLVICNFKGTTDGDYLHLTIPSIHSVDKSFGPNDHGQDGIKEVFKNHRCNDICRNKDWIKP